MEYHDLYCERIGPGLLAEPVNAATNAAFFIAGWLGWRDLRRHQAVHASTRVLIALVLAIGVGSGLFHTFATGWARVLDELPILIFQLLYLFVYARRAMRSSRWVAAGIVAVYLALALYCRGFDHLLNGSLVYAPAVGIMLLLGVWHWRAQARSRFVLLGAAGTLVMAVVLRTLDARVCAEFPLGTHFLWHLLVATVTYLCLRGLAAAHDPQAARGETVSVRAGAPRF